MNDVPSRGKLKQLKTLKEKLIRRYLKLQDEADKVNERVYGVCCEVEKINLEIQEEEVRLKKLAAAATSGSRSPR